MDDNDGPGGSDIELTSQGAGTYWWVAGLCIIFSFYCSVQCPHGRYISCCIPAIPPHISFTHFVLSLSILSANSSVIIILSFPVRFLIYTYPAPPNYVQVPTTGMFREGGWVQRTAHLVQGTFVFRCCCGPCKDISLIISSTLNTSQIQ